MARKGEREEEERRIAYSLVDLGAGFLPDLAALRLGVCRALRDLALDLCCDVVRVTWGWVVRIGNRFLEEKVFFWSSLTLKLLLGCAWRTARRIKVVADAARCCEADGHGGF
jgi:hypothetical protein